MGAAAAAGRSSKAAHPFDPFINEHLLQKLGALQSKLCFEDNNSNMIIKKQKQKKTPTLPMSKHKETKLSCTA